MSEGVEGSFKVNSRSKQEQQRQSQQGFVLLSFAPLERDSSADQPMQAKQLEAQKVADVANYCENNNNDNSSTTPQPHLATFKGPQNGGQHPELARGASRSKEGRKHKAAASSDKAPATKRSIKDSNSLESISSKFSISSANDDSQHHQLPPKPTTIPTTTSASNGRHQSIVAVRYVSPPSVGAAKSPLKPQTDSAPLGSSASDPVGRRQQDAKAEKVEKADKEDKADKAPSTGNGYNDDHRSSDGDMVEVDLSSPNAATASRAPKSRNPKPPFPFAGVAASILGSVFFSLSVLCVKLLPDSDGIHEKAKVLFFRGFFMMIFCGSAMFLRHTSFLVPRKELWVNIARAVMGTVAVFGSYCSLNYISMGDSTALVFSSPIWTSILSHFLLKEPLQWLQLFALPASLFGIVLIAHPDLVVNVEHLSLTHHHHLLSLINTSAITINAHVTEAALATTTPAGSELAPQEANTLIDAGQATADFDFDHRWPGIVIALSTSLLVSFNYIVLKFRKETPIQTTTFWFGSCMVFSSLAIMSAIGFGEIPSTLIEWSLLFGNGLSSWLGQSFLQWAFQYEDAGVLSIVRTLDVAMTFILSALFLDDDIYWTSIVGATIIGLVVASIMLNNWIRNLTCCISRATEFEHQQVSTVNDATGNVMQMSKSSRASTLQQNCRQFSATKNKQLAAANIGSDKRSPYIMEKA